jgi:hypothetical protein
VVVSDGSMVSVPMGVVVGNGNSGSMGVGVGVSEGALSVGRMVVIVGCDDGDGVAEGVVVGVAV